MRTIRVLGSENCPRCEALYNKAKRIVEENGIKAKVEHSTDIKELIEADVMESPALIIDGKVAFSGDAPDDKKLIEILRGKR